MPKVGLACAAIGAVAAVVGAVVGVLLIENKEFVVATIRCNLTDPDSLGNSSNCVSNKLVDPDTGATCRVGNLGLFTAEYNPECTRGQVGYDLTTSPPPLDAPFSSNTKDFGILFPAQTQFAGIFAELPLDFEDCTSYLSSPLFTAGVSALGTSRASSGFLSFAAAFLPSVKSTVEPVANLVDGFLTGACATAYAGVTDEFSSTLPFPADTSATYGPFSNFFEALNISAITKENDPDPEEQAVGAKIRGVLNILLLGFSLSGSSTNPEVQFNTACGFGYTGSAGLPENGFFSRVYGSPGSGVLCSLVGQSSGCSFAGLLFAQQSSPEIDLLQGLLGGFIVGYNTRPETAPFRAVLGENFGVADFEEIVDKIVASTATDDETNFFNLALEKDVFWANVENFLSVADIIPNINTFDFTTVYQNLVALTCQPTGLNIPPSQCNFFNIVGAVFAQLNANPLLNSPDKLVRAAAESSRNSAGLLLTLMTKCQVIPPPVTTVPACVAKSLNFTVTPDNSQTLLDAAAETLFRAFYRSARGQTFEEYVEETIEKCEDNDKDIAAIAQAQTFVPAGVALGFVGAAGAVVASALVLTGKGGNAAKHVTLVSGIMALAGVVLVLVALLGILNAPIYRSVGGSSGPIEDNTQLRAQGPGASLAYITLGAGLVGTLFILGGAVALYIGGKDESESNILAKA